MGSDAGALRSGDWLSGQEIAAHLESAAKALPAGVKTVRARADSGFYCWQAVEACEKLNRRFIVAARKTARLVDASLSISRGVGQSLPVPGAALQKTA